MAERRVLVTGAGGFIGNHLVNRLRSEGCFVRGVDLVAPTWGTSAANEFVLGDLRDPRVADEACRGIDDVFALAADMGGMGFISHNHARILHHNSLIDLNTVHAASTAGVQRLLYASSACVYPQNRQAEASLAPLREEEAWPADPQDAYGFEKLLGEELCRHYGAEGRLQTRIVRFHNIYGPLGTWRGGREKAPAAMCRKVAVAKLTGNPKVEIWGDGAQTRSFCYIDDCLEGITRLLDSKWTSALNLGTERIIAIDDLADLVADIAGIEIEKVHVSGPMGVRGRNSDNTRLREVLGWEPQVSLEDGLRSTYTWIEEQVRRAATLEPVPPVLQPELARG